MWVLNSNIVTFWNLNRIGWGRGGGKRSYGHEIFNPFPSLHTQGKSKTSTYLGITISLNIIYPPPPKCSRTRKWTKRTRMLTFLSKRNRRGMYVYDCMLQIPMWSISLIKKKLGRGSKFHGREIFNSLPLLLVHAIGYQHFIDWKVSCMYKCSKYKCCQFFSSKKNMEGRSSKYHGHEICNPPPPPTHTSPTPAHSWKHKGIQLPYYKAIVFDPSFLYKETNSHSQSWETFIPFWS